jgi:hypothetical protein
MPGLTVNRQGEDFHQPSPTGQGLQMGDSGSLGQGRPKFTSIKIQHPPKGRDLSRIPVELTKAEWRGGSMGCPDRRWCVKNLLCNGLLSAKES